MVELKPEDMKDIQGFVVSGYAHLPCVSYVMLRVVDAPAGEHGAGPAHHTVSRAAAVMDGRRAAVGFELGRRMGPSHERPVFRPGDRQVRVPMLWLRYAPRSRRGRYL